ncbi:hypothetical protein WJ93_07000 [Burkholderia ubonensis]|nr:hypothetical protein WJ93_07000 [Burkholderia ubonensis]
MDATSWQNLRTQDSFVPDEHLAGRRLTLSQRFDRQAVLLAERLDIPLVTARKLVGFWQPTAKVPTAFSLFWAIERHLPLVSEEDIALPASWLNRQTPVKELLKLVSANPTLFCQPAPDGTRIPRNSFFTIVRDGLAFHGYVSEDFAVFAERAQMRENHWNHLGGVELGPGSIQPDDAGGFMLAKYHGQRKAKLPGLSEHAAQEVADAFGLGSVTDFGGWNSCVGFFASPAMLGLLSWFVQHPRKCAQWSGVNGSTAYLGAWFDAAMVRAEFELVRAGVL